MATSFAAEHTDFLTNLNTSGVIWLCFASNEGMALKHRPGYKNRDTESIKKGISIVEGLMKDISSIGKRPVIARYVSAR